MADTLEIYGIEYTNVTGIKATDDNGNVLTYVRPSGSMTLTDNQSNVDVSTYATVTVTVPSAVGVSF